MLGPLREGPAIRFLDLESVVLRFFIVGSGEMRCRATDTRTRETWLVPSAAELHRLVRSDRPATSQEPPQE